MISMQRLVVVLKGELLMFVKTYNLHISDYELFGSTNDKSTYVNDALFTSWLDHYIWNFPLYNKMIDKLPISDHLPLSVAFKHDGDISNDIANICNDSLPYSYNQTCNWHKATPGDINRYEHTTKTFLCNIRIPLEALAYTDSRCESMQHKNDFDNMYAEVNEALHRARELTIPTHWCNKVSQYIILGWNKYVLEAHIEARHAYIIWRDFGKSSHGSVCGLMKVTRLRFKYPIRQCQAMEEIGLAVALATSLPHKDMTSFWKSIRNMSDTSISPSRSMNGSTGRENSSEIWS